MAKGDLKKSVEGAKTEMSELLFATRDFTDEVKKSAKEVFGVGTSANQATKAFRDIGSSLTDMSSSMDSIVEGTKTTTDLAKQQNKYAKAQAKFQTEYRQALDKARVSQKDIEKILKGQLSIDQLKVKNANLAYSSEGDLLSLYEEQFKINQENASIMAEMADRADNIQAGVGLAGAAFSSMGKTLKKAGLGDLGDKMGLDEAVEEGRALSAQLTNGGEASATIATKLKVAGKMAKTIGKNLLDSFGPIALMGIVVKETKQAFIDMDTANGKLAKNLGISYQQAANLNSEFIDLAYSSGELNVSLEQIQQTQEKLNKAYNTGGKFTGALSVDFASIQERTELSDEAMGFLVHKQIKGEKTMKNQLKTLNKTVTKFNIQNKMTLNVNKVMENIAKTSKAVQLATKRNVGELANAVMQAQMLGAEMGTVEGIGASLLDFESSIANELEAELLLGQDINLEKARQFALTGDMAGLTGEIMNQEAIMNAFATDNVIAQEAAAKALGLSREQLADMIYKQEELEALQSTFGDGVKDVNGAYQAYLEMKEKEMTDEEIFAQLGNENVERQLKSISAQEAKNKAIEKERLAAKELANNTLKSSQNLEGSVQSMVKMVKYAGIAMGIFKTIEGISKLTMIYKQATAFAEGLNAKNTRLSNLGARKSLVPLGTRLSLMVGQAAAWVVMNPIAAVAGLALAAGAGALIYDQMKDGVIGPDGGMVVSGPKGSIQLDKQDSIIAGTNLGGGGGGGSPQAQQNSDEMIALLKDIANKTTVIEMGGNEVGQGINTAEREIQ